MDGYPHRLLLDCNSQSLCSSDGELPTPCPGDQLLPEPCSVEGEGQNSIDQRPDAGLREERHQPRRHALHRRQGRDHAERRRRGGDEVA